MTKAARMVAGHSIAGAGKASGSGPELASGEDVVEVDGVLYRQRKAHTPLYDERGRMVDWVWTHMELWPLHEEETRAEKEKERGSKDKPKLGRSIVDAQSENSTAKKSLPGLQQASARRR